MIRSNERMERSRRGKKNYAIYYAGETILTHVFVVGFRSIRVYSNRNLIIVLTNACFTFIISIWR